MNSELKFELALSKIPHQNFKDDFWTKILVVLSKIPHQMFRDELWMQIWLGDRIIGLNFLLSSWLDFWLKSNFVAY